MIGLLLSAAQCYILGQVKKEALVSPHEYMMLGLLLALLLGGVAYARHIGKSMEAGDGKPVESQEEGDATMSVIRMDVLWVKNVGRGRTIFMIRHRVVLSNPSRPSWRQTFRTP